VSAQGGQPAAGAAAAPDAGYRVYGYRWVVLGAFMFANLAIQILWISYAPVTTSAAAYYGVSESTIGWFSMVFMIAFVPLSLPAAWLIDARGLRAAVGLGVVLMAVFGVLRGLAGADFTLAMLATVGIAVAQPFLLNAWTTMGSHWFPARQRALAVGLITLANLVGTGIGVALTPLLIESRSIASVQLLFGVVGAVSAAAFLALARERPATPPCPPGMEERALMLDGLRHALTVAPFLVYLGLVFVGMGVFNGVTTWVEQIVHPRGFSEADAGVVGAAMLVGGLLGAVVIPALSDRHGRRVPYLVVCFALAIPGLLGVALFSSLWPLIAASLVLGFFLVPALPVGMQYAAEVTWPTPEGTSNGLIQLCGQVAVVFVYVMSALRSADGSFTLSLLLAAGLLLVAAVVASRLREPPPASARTAGGGEEEALRAATTTAAGSAAGSGAPDAPRPPAPVG
jgi:MFS family permease